MQFPKVKKWHFGVLVGTTATLMVMIGIYRKITAPRYLDKYKNNKYLSI